MGANTVRFESFEIQPVARQLFANGIPAKLGARAFDLLLVLIEHRDRIVSKDELLDRVWPGLVVEENNLQVHLSTLRKMLGPRAVVTIPGRGYRFTSVQIGVDEAPPAAVPAPGHEALSIPVLPFVNGGADSEKDDFDDGITEDIITDLSRWRSLAVTSRQSTFRFKGMAVDMQEVGRDLNVRFLVGGSVRRMGERIGVTAQLVDAETGNQIWGERFDRPRADRFAVQDEVVHTIVGTLVGRVHASGADRARRKPPSSLDAYDQTLRGDALLWDDGTSVGEAKAAFERAIEIDPGYGLPYSLLAVLLSREWENDLSALPVTLDRAFALAKRGVELADDESTCHTIMGQVCLERRSFDLALHHTERGVEINPANQWNRADRGIILAYVGRAEEGLEMLRDARRADPYFGPRWYSRGLALAQFVLRRSADALPEFERGVTNNSLRALAMMVGRAAKLGLADRAQEIVARCLTGQPRATVNKIVAKIAFKNAGDSLHLVECLRLAGVPE